MLKKGNDLDVLSFWALILFTFWVLHVLGGYFVEVGGSRPQQRVHNTHFCSEFGQTWSQLTFHAMGRPYRTCHPTSWLPSYVHSWFKFWNIRCGFSVWKCIVSLKSKISSDFWVSMLEFKSESGVVKPYYCLPQPLWVPVDHAFSSLKPLEWTFFQYTCGFHLRYWVLYLLLIPHACREDCKCIKWNRIDPVHCCPRLRASELYLISRWTCGNVRRMSRL
jgi:hypothetical protein